MKSKPVRKDTSICSLGYESLLRHGTYTEERPRRSSLLVKSKYSSREALALQMRGDTLSDRKNEDVFPRQIPCPSEAPLRFISKSGLADSTDMLLSEGFQEVQLPQYVTSSASIYIQLCRYDRRHPGFELSNCVLAPHPAADYNLLSSCYQVVREFQDTALLMIHLGGSKRRCVALPCSPELHVHQLC